MLTDRAQVEDPTQHPYIHPTDTRYTKSTKLNTRYGTADTLGEGASIAPAATTDTNTHTRPRHSRRS
jgi:hypothetical protein